jgi:FkbM family methyltransferase
MNFYFEKVVGKITRAMPSYWRERLLRMPFSSLVRDSFSKILSEGQTTVEIQSGLVRGYKMELDLKSEKANWFGIKESSIQELFTKVVEKDMVAYDVGAKIGYTALMLKHLVEEDGEVLAFEPLPDNYRRLEKNVSLNGCRNVVSSFQYALSDKSGTQPFTIRPQLGMGRLSEVEHEKDKVRDVKNVDCRTIDEFALNSIYSPPDFIKIDVEGAEHLVLKGAEKTIKKYSPIMVVETHNKNATRKTFEILQSVGYEVRDVYDSLSLVHNSTALGNRSYILALPDDGPICEYS